MGQLFYSQKIGSKVFRGVSTKEAYMKSIKWYASNIIAKDELHNVQVEFVKDEKERKVTLLLFAVLPEKEVLEQHCENCKEMHRSFFINEDTHCDRCSTLGYQKRLERHLSVKVGYYKELLRKIAKEEGVDSDE